MSSTICPTITTDDPDVYRLQIQRSVSFASRIHIDLADGIFTKNHLTRIEDVWWPGGVWADLHVMYKQPFEHAEALIALKPQLIIVHAEADGDFVKFAELAHDAGIEVGVALLPETPAKLLAPALEYIEHVLIFSGSLGSFGGHADLSLLDKITELRKLKPQLEIGWDGGVNDKNARAMVEGGVDVLNAGGFLHGSRKPEKSYQLLLDSISK